MKERGDPLPESFESEEQAGAFWDCHSTMDYQECLEATDDTIDISDCYHQRPKKSEGAKRDVMA